MFLKNLTIESRGIQIRSINFKKGLNLIIDETKTEDKKESGNNLGKTTILRLVDFCLGGDGSNIYQDKEFSKSSNTQIENFLKDNAVVIVLTLKENLDIRESEEVIIKRNFLNRKSKIQEINGTEYNNADFNKKLKEQIFKSEQDKPTIRQIIGRNIRDEKNKLTNTVKILPFGTSEEYETLYLFWLGIESDSGGKKQKLIREKSIEVGIQTRLRKESTQSQVEQSLLVINRSISELETKKRKLNTNDNFKDDLTRLNEIQSQINKITTEISSLEFRKSLILESKADLDSENISIDTNLLKAIYESAGLYIHNLQKTFDQTVEFHKAMLDEKRKFIVEELPELESAILTKKSTLDVYISDENILTKKLHKLGAFEGIESIISELNLTYEKRGSYERLKNLWESTSTKIEEVDVELNDINNEIRSKDTIIQTRIAEFNKYFSDLSYELYGERFVLSAEYSDNKYELNISSISGNLGTGKKKGQIAAFDLAYILFADSIGIRCLHFIMHDQLENVHGNQINVLANIVAKVNCQYIVPILRDKLPTSIDISTAEIISLSQENKLFKVK